MDDTSPSPSIPGTTRRHWLFATLILCSYGFFKEFKPSEPFLTPFLVSNVKNFTNAQLSSEVWPYSTYSYLIASLLVCLFTDIVRYKPVIVLESGCYLATRILLIWGVTTASMQWMQVAYGVAEATEIAYYSYIYAAVSSVHFKKVTSYVRAIRLFGQSMAGFLGQILVSTGALGYLELNYISLASVSVACVFSLLLPNVFNCSKSCGRKQTSEIDEVTSLLDQPSKKLGSCCLQWIKKAVLNRARDFAKFYCTPSLLKWSIWWALATCGVLQVGNYVQNLWTKVADENGHEINHSYWNGVVEAIATLCSAGAAFSLSFVRVHWAEWGELTIGLLSLVDSGLLLLASWSSQLWLVYLCHIIYRTTYAFLITVARYMISLCKMHFNVYFTICTFLFEYMYLTVSFVTYSICSCTCTQFMHNFLLPPPHTHTVHR